MKNWGLYGFGSGFGDWQWCNGVRWSGESRMMGCGIGTLLFGVVDRAWIDFDDGIWNENDGMDGYRNRF